MDAALDELPPGPNWFLDPHINTTIYFATMWRCAVERGSLVAIRATEAPLDHRGQVAHSLLLALADHCVGCAGLDVGGGLSQVTVDLDTRFISPARTGDLLEGRGDCAVDVESMANCA